MSINLPDNVQLDTYESKYTPEQIEASIGKGTIIQNGTFWVWDVETMQYQDTGVYATPGPGSIVTEMLADSSATWPKLSPEARKSNDNLLDNAYFIGGGSQQGGGQFPINQRGLTEYTGAGYTIDRWMLSNNVCRLTIESDGIRLTQNSVGNNSVFFIQRKQIVELPDGEYTFSAIVDNELLSITFDLSTSMGVVNSGGDKFRLRAQYLNGDYNFSVYGNVISPTDSCKIVAAKLELGPYQTLAYQDAAGNWILNDPPPKFGAELEACQRYYYILRPDKGQAYGAFGVGVSTYNGTAYLALPLPVQMRAKPTATYSGAVSMQRVADSAYIPVSSLTVNASTGNFINLLFGIQGAVAGEIWRGAFQNDKNAYIALDANL